MRLSDYSDLNDYTVQVYTKYDIAFVEFVVDLCRPFSESNKPKAINYAPEQIRRYFNNGRFAHGFYIVKFRGSIVVTFGVDDYKGWGVISRYLRHGNSSFFIPFGHGVGIPFAHEHLKNKIVGLCSTQNKDQKDLIGILHKYYSKNIEDDGMFGVAARTAAQVKKINYDIIYRDTLQTAYTYYTDLTPPFQAASTSFNRSAA